MGMNINMVCNLEKGAFKVLMEQAAFIDSLYATQPHICMLLSTYL